MKTIAVLEFDEDGNAHGLWTENIDLYEIGQISDVRRASSIKFNEDKQIWEVFHATTQKIVHRNKSRLKAIEWEIEHFSVRGKYYHGDK